MAKVTIKLPTTRKVRNRGYTPIRYHTPANDFRTGWLTGAETRVKVQIVLVGDERARWIRKDELRYVTEL